MERLKTFIKFFVTLLLLFGPFTVAIWYDDYRLLVSYFLTISLLKVMYTDVRSAKKYTRTKKFIAAIFGLIFFSSVANAQFSGKMYERALPEQTISVSVHPMSKGFGIMFDHMVFSTQAMMYYTLAADNFGVENSEATWPEHISASIGLQYCTPERDPKDPQLRAGFGIKYSSLHTVNGCQSPTIDLSDFRPELKIAVRIEKWLTFGVRVDLWEANSAIDIGYSF
jgi:hypothetical protein